MTFFCGILGWLFIFPASRIFIFVSGCLQIDVITCCYIRYQGKCDVAGKNIKGTVLCSIRINYRFPVDSPPLPLTGRMLSPFLFFFEISLEKLPGVDCSNNHTGQLNKVDHYNNLIFSPGFRFQTIHTMWKVKRKKATTMKSEEEKLTKAWKNI